MPPSTILPQDRDEEEKKSGDGKGKNDKTDLFFSTYGISADPLAQFAVVFAALVHDVDHTGVPNVQLIKEKPDLASKYKNISVAENNSIKCAWSELMQPEFANLRKCIFETNEDETRFRQLLINVVIPTLPIGNGGRANVSAGRRHLLAIPTGRTNGRV